MAREIYKPEQISAELDALLPQFNKGSSTPIPKELAMSILMTENMDKDGNVSFQNAVSPAGAQGVGQVMPGTLQLLKKAGFLPADFPDDLTKAPVRQQVQASLAAMKEIVSRIKSTDPDKVGANYNASPRATQKFMETGNTMYLPAETQMYLPKMQKAYEMQGVEYPSVPVPQDVKPSSALTNIYKDAEQQFVTNMSLAQAAIKAITGASADSAVQSKIRQQAIIKSAESAAESARLSVEEIVANQAAQQELVNKFGLNIDDPQSALNLEMQRASQARVNREKLDARITELQSKSLFSDPLGWLMAVPEIASLVPQYNQQATLENSAISNITRLQQFATTQKNLTASRSVDLLRAKAAADANATLEKAKAQAASANMANVANQAKVALDQLNIGRGIFQEIKDLEDRDFRALVKAWHIQEADEKKQLKAVQDKKESILVDGINFYREFLQGRSARENPLTLQDLKVMPAKERAIWENMALNKGFGNFRNAVELLSSGVIPVTNDGNKEFRSMVNNIAITARAMAPKLQGKHNAVNPLARIDEKQAMQLAYDQLYSDMITEASSNYDKGGMGSAGDFSVYAIDFDAAAAAAKATPNSVVSKVLLRAKDAAQYKSLNESFSPRTFFAAVVGEAQAGAITPTKAAEEVAAFMKATSDRQYAARGLEQLGVIRLDNFTIKPGAMGNKPVDLFNSASIEAYLTAEVAQMKRQKEAAGATNIMFPFGKDPFNIMGTPR